MIVKRKLITIEFSYRRTKSVLGKSVCDGCKYAVVISERKCCSQFISFFKNCLCGSTIIHKNRGKTPYDLRKIKYVYRLC